MSSNIRITRVCQQCGIDFEARKTVTKFCSQPCAAKAYKARAREVKINASERETNIIRNKPIETIKTKEFLTVRDVARLLNSSRQTVYSLINSGNLKAVNLGERKTLIKRADIDKLFA